MSTLTGLRLLLGLRFIGVSVLAAAVTALVIGLPTDVIPNPWWTRMTPVRPLDVALLPVTSVLVGMLVGTYAIGRRSGDDHTLRNGVASGTLGWFAIGCPVCNKLVVALLGFSGALQYFRPVQPLLGVLSVGLAAWALRVRVRALTEPCELPPRRQAPARAA